MLRLIQGALAPHNDNGNDTSDEATTARLVSLALEILLILQRGPTADVDYVRQFMAEYPDVAQEVEKQRPIFVAAGRRYRRLVRDARSRALSLGIDRTRSAAELELFASGATLRAYSGGKRKSVDSTGVRTFPVDFCGSEAWQRAHAAMVSRFARAGGEMARR